MEIQELIFFYLHENSNQVEVQFRLNIDSDEEIRTDLIDLNEANDFGFDLIMEDYTLNEDDDEDEFYWLESPSIDEDNLISFMNEYYIVNPDKLPKPELI
jgi:hypothetical protein